MSILIKGADMPKPGQIVLFEIDENGDVFAAYDGGRTKLAQYKAIPVPPHGDLIDRDAAYDKIAEQDGGNYVDMDAVDMGLNETPVIISGDEAWPEWRTRVQGIRREEESAKGINVPTYDLLYVEGGAGTT